MEWYWVLLIVVSGVLVLSLGAYLTLKNKKFRALVYDWVCTAEQTFTGTKQGAEKFAFVVEKIHGWLPSWSQLLIPESFIKKVIEYAVAEMKEALSKGPKETK